MDRVPALLMLLFFVLLPQPAASEPVSEQFQWHASGPSDTKAFIHGPLTVRLASPSKKVADDSTAEISLTISAEGMKAAHFSDDSGRGPSAVLQFAELDSTNRFPEILFTTHSGGHHCCYRTSAFTFTGKRWIRVSEARASQGGVPDVLDIDGDGRAEVTEPDAAFWYAFSSYARSNPPARVYRLVGVKWVDVTNSPGFREYQRTEQKLVDENCGPEKSSNGFWAGYVASEMIRGEGKAAWARMLACYDQKDSWGICRPGEWGSFEPQPSDFGDAPRSEKCVIRFRSFPTALDHFLRENGYGRAVSRKELARWVRMERPRRAAETAAHIDAEKKLREFREENERLLAKRASSVELGKPDEISGVPNEPPASRLRRRKDKSIEDQVNECWQILDAGGKRFLSRVKVSIWLRPNGTLARPPVANNPPSDARVVDAVLSGVSQCAPYWLPKTVKGEEQLFEVTF